MKKILLYSVFFLFLDACSESPPTKIYPKQGLFPKTQSRYELLCFIEHGLNQDRVDYDLTIDDNYVSLQQKNISKIFVTKKIDLNRDTTLGFIVEDGKEYLLFRNTGDFGIDPNNTGYCIEKGCGWLLDKKKNTLNYYCNK